MTQSFLIRGLFYPLTLLYRVAVQLHRFLYISGIKARVQLPGITISVGNIVAGGTGKSPVVIELARFLIAAGQSPVILTRGYRSGLKSGEFLEMKAGAIVRQQMIARRVFPDEAIMQSHALPTVPVVVGADRRAAANWFLNHATTAPTHWILDDGMQHWPLHRDVEIVLLDAQKPFGNRMTFPLGRLREAPKSLNRADLVLVTRSPSLALDPELAGEIGTYFAGQLAPVVFSTGFPTCIAPGISLDLTDPKNSVLLAVGIGHPKQFIDDVTKLGLHIGSEYLVGDHNRFNAEILRQRCAGCAAIVTTKKDYWRDPDIFTGMPIPIFIADLTVNSLVSDFSRILRL
jgi:tetraacyldisaccharide 4'-kinase